jgi:YihY family inner membrane protein
MLKRNLHVRRPHERCRQAANSYHGTAQRLSCLLVLETVPLSWSELARRTWREVVDDDVMGLAAQLSYYFFLALFPAILFLLALASFFPLSNVTDDVGRALGPFVSPQLLELIQEQVRRLANNGNGGLLTFGVAGALWSSSAALASIVGALNRAYDIEEGRPWWKVRLVAIGLTLGVATIVLVALSLVLVGPTVAEKLGQATGWGAPFEWTWLVLQWPLVFALIAVGIGLISKCRRRRAITQRHRKKRSRYPDGRCPPPQRCPAHLARRTILARKTPPWHIF